MTKVKTILAEFCTAKDILAINRLGLLKKEERESQPIPWRHRLPIKERRELVRSELRMSARPPTHHSKKEATRALSSARTLKDSKLGECLLNSQSKADSCLVTSLRGISGEERRSKSQLQQLKKSFLRQSACLNHEPMILVERPPSPKVKSRAAFKKKHGVDPVVATVPSYMRPLNSRARTPSTLTTIEAFTVETKKKRNVWEEAVEDREERKFKSMSRPTARLTEFEKKQLKIGHTLHKPTQESIAALAEDATTDEETAATSSSPLFQKRDQFQRRSLKGSNFNREDPFERPDTIAEGSVFVTQMSQMELEKSGKGHLKSVTFSDVRDNNKPKRKSTQDSSSRKLLLLQENGEVRRRIGRQEHLGFSNDDTSASTGSKKGTAKGGKGLKSSTTTEKEKKAKSFFSVILNHDQ